MKILIVSPNYPNISDRHTYGFVHSRAKIYEKKGNSVKVFVPSSSEKLAYKYEGIDVLRASWDSFRPLLNDFDSDVIAVHAPRGRWFTHIFRENIPIISWIHGAEALFQAFHHYYFPFSLKDNVLKVMSLVADPIKCLQLGRFLDRCTAVVYASRWMREMAEKYTFRSHPKSFIIPNPVDVDLFSASNLDFSERSNLGVSVRALEWKYGIDIAIKAYSALKESHLLIIGKGSLEQYLKRLAKAYVSNVEFETKGVPHEDLPKTYSRFKFFIAPSRTEAQGVAMCEAMASGLPIIATRVGGIPEFVKDGFNGLLVPAGHPLDLRKAVLLLASNPELNEKLSENAVNFVQKELSHVRIYEREYEVFTLAQEAYQNR